MKRNSLITKSNLVFRIMPIIIAALSISILSGCETPIRNHQLKSLNTRLSTPEIDADAARNIYLTLKHISVDSLNEAERNFRSFLLIKSADKAYISHSNDTTYLNVKEYFRTEHTELYPEVLYYGGRVYSDIGDTQTALEHFTDALDLVKESKENLPLQAKICSQMGQTLNRLRIYDQAEEYLKDAIQIGNELSDSTGLAFDYNSLGYVYMHQGKFGEAKFSFNRSKTLSDKLSSSIIFNDNYLAFIYSQMGNNHMAIKLIRKALSNKDSLSWSTIKGHAALIYLRAGVLDTAYMHAHDLATTKTSYARELGYEIMLSPELIHRAPKDSLSYFFSNYKSLLDAYYDNNKNQAAINQNASYNYRIHERERVKAEEKNYKLKKLIGIATAMVLIVLILLGYQKYRYQKKLVRLHKALDNVKNLKRIKEINEIESSETAKEIEPDKMNDELKPILIVKEVEAIEKDTDYQAQNSDLSLSKAVQLSQATEDVTRLRIDSTNNEPQNIDETLMLKERIEKELESLITPNGSVYHVPSELLQSEIYKTLRQRLKDDKSIAPDNPIWGNIEELVLAISPRFQTNLKLLSNGKLKNLDYQITLLMKFGISPVEISVLICRERSTITYHRKKICNMILGSADNSKLELLEYVIGLL